MKRQRRSRLEQRHVAPHQVNGLRLSNQRPLREFHAVDLVPPERASRYGERAGRAVDLHKIPDVRIHYARNALVIQIPVRVVVGHDTDVLSCRVAYLLERNRYLRKHVVVKEKIIVFQHKHYAVVGDIRRRPGFYARTERRCVAGADTVDLALAENASDKIYRAIRTVVCDDADAHVYSFV